MELTSKFSARVPARSRDAATAAAVDLRRLTARSRPLPELLIIGAQRSGTSSLYKYLEHHPCVVPSLRKETHYFSLHYEKGPDWYRAHFPSEWRRAVTRGRRGQVLTFESTPYYLFHPRAAVRAASVVPDARILVLLRNPVERAFSHYCHNVRHGREALSFEDALAAEPERLAGEVERMMADGAYRSRRHARFSYVARGLYAEQLLAWMEQFPAERFMVVRSEDLFERTPDIYAEVLAFLGIPPWQPKRFENFSYVNRRPTGATTMHPDTRRRLLEQFAPHNRRLEELLSRSLDWDA